MNTKRKCVLAFSGGLDTSYCAKYLSENPELEVYSVTVNTGGFNKEELERISGRAEDLGVVHHTVLDVTETFYKKGIRYLLYGNVLKNGTYPLSVSAERVFQAMAIAEYTTQIGAGCIAHGSTGAGNDQVRFDLIFNILCPGVDILTPIRDQQLSREQEIRFLENKDIQISRNNARYSVNQGLWGTSVGGAETLTSHLPLPEEAWPVQVTETEPQPIELIFEQGQLVGINGARMNPVEAIRHLHDIAAPYGIGRDVHVGDTIIGIKGRVGFEAAAPLIAIKAHHLLEKHILSKWQLHWKQQLADWYGMMLHEGQYLDPVMRNIETFLEASQQNITGEVYATLHPYRFELSGINSSFDMMQAQKGQYGEMNAGWSGEDVKGFTKILANSSATLIEMNPKTTEIT